MFEILYFLVSQKSRQLRTMNFTSLHVLTLTTRLRISFSLAASYFIWIFKNQKNYYEDEGRGMPPVSPSYVNIGKFHSLI